MILRDNGEVETEDDSDSEKMPELKDDGIEYHVDEEMSSRLPSIRDIVHQIKANKDHRFIFKHDDWVWVHVTTEGIHSPFDVGDNSRSNPFEEGRDDVIHASHGPLIHLTQNKDHIEDILEANEILEDQNKHETKLRDKENAYKNKAKRPEFGLKKTGKRIAETIIDHRVTRTFKKYHQDYLVK
ncbi:Uncharacterized protein Adt_14306 [Abeliophyllum distichum]|uniref:Uncharacterized protein n=1 Tax=Abeliophyllum distichum TaxID=126358 RepID=A0ABD1TZB2_9LAMI